jgi:RND family efflux transporter MFP subunit
LPNPSRANVLDLPAGVPDTDLLARYAASRDEVAFELLLRRHAPMVLAVCRRLLVDPNDADDAFQATFLVLARKAGAVASGEALAAFLHRVAFRAALRVRTGRNRRIGREGGRVEDLPSRSPLDPGEAELIRVLDEEVVQLPARHRNVFVLCCLEGKTGEEAARLLGSPAGTVSSRLTRARERLRARLTRRGYAPAALLSSTLGASGVASAVLPALLASTLRAIPSFVHTTGPAALTTRPVVIAQEVLQTMFLNKLRWLSLLAVGLIAAGGVLAGFGGEDSKSDRPSSEGKGAEAAHPLAQAKAGADDKAKRPVVQVAQARAAGHGWVSRQTSKAEPFRETTLYPQVSGTVKKVSVEEGDRVKAGQLLAEIDSPALILDTRTAQVAVDQAQGLLREAEARLAVSQTEVQAAEGVLKQRLAEVAQGKAAVDRWEKELARVTQLKNNAVLDAASFNEVERQHGAAKALLESATLSVESARTEVTVRRAKSREVEAGVGLARANGDTAKIAVEKAQLLADQTRVVAPFDGVVISRNCLVGDTVIPSATLSRPLFTLMQTDVMRFAFPIASEQFPVVRVGTPVEVIIPNLNSGTLIEAKLARISAVAKTGGLLLNAFEGEIELPNPKGEIRPGMTAGVRLTLGEVVRVPQEAVTYQWFGHNNELVVAQVYVYRNGKAHLTNVTRGNIDGKTGTVEILSGLKPTDKVITDPKDLTGREIEVEVEKGP